MSKLNEFFIDRISASKKYGQTWDAGFWEDTQLQLQGKTEEEIVKMVKIIIQQCTNGMAKIESPIDPDYGLLWHKRDNYTMILRVYEGTVNWNTQ